MYEVFSFSSIFAETNEKNMNSHFHVIDRSTWERSIYFDYYYSQIKCKYNLNANLDITRLVAVQKARGLRFFPVMLYVIMKAVNRNKEFRMCSVLNKLTQFI